MNNIIAQREAARDNQSLMIMTMEKKLNGGSFAWFKYFNRRDQNLSKISVAQYWDLLTYIDDDYLSDYEVVRMKELYSW